jgi:hypothetical protein
MTLIFLVPCNSHTISLNQIYFFTYSTLHYYISLSLSSFSRNFEIFWLFIDGRTFYKGRQYVVVLALWYRGTEYDVNYLLLFFLHSHTSKLSSSRRWHTRKSVNVVSRHCLPNIALHIEHMQKGTYVNTYRLCAHWKEYLAIWRHNQDHILRFLIEEIFGNIIYFSNPLVGSTVIT